MKHTTTIDLLNAARDVLALLDRSPAIDYNKPICHLEEVVALAALELQGQYSEESGDRYEEMV